MSRAPRARRSSRPLREMSRLRAGCLRTGRPSRSAQPTGGPSRSSISARSTWRRATESRKATVWARSDRPATPRSTSPTSTWESATPTIRTATSIRSRCCRRARSRLRRRQPCPRLPLPPSAPRPGPTRTARSSQRAPRGPANPSPRRSRRSRRGSRALLASGDPRARRGLRAGHVSLGASRRPAAGHVPCCIRRRGRSQPPNERRGAWSSRVCRAPRRPCGALSRGRAR